MGHFDQKRLNLYPQDPGVYLMKNQAGAILYIGKAKVLRSRLKQYFLAGGDGRWMVPFLIAELSDIETLVTKSEKEALLLENTLIKKHKPRFNALLKDDKTYTAIMVNNLHPWPMLQLVRYKGKPKAKGLYFGPYASTYSARETLDALQKIFPLRQCSDQELLRRERPCILYGMKRCSAPCVGLVSKEAYQEDVSNAIKFLKGQNKEIVEALRKKRDEASALLDFEKAQEIHHLLESIEKTLQPQSVDAPLKGFSGIALNLYRQGDEVLLSELQISTGRVMGYRHLSFSKIAEEDSELFSTYLLQTYHDSEFVPDEVLLPVELEDKEALEEVLNLKISVAKRGDRLSYSEMAFKNAEAAFKQKKDASAIREKTLLEIQEKLRLTRFPERIECYDNSHLAGSEFVSAKVSFFNGEPDKKQYRHYKLTQADPSDDYAAMREVLTRRFSKEKEQLPDLVIIDGGKGHLNAAKKIFDELNIVSCDLIGLAKEEGRHDKGITHEQVFLLNQKDPVHFTRHAQALFFLQRIRDEAHRFAIEYQKKRRTKGVIRTLLADIPGIGPAKQKKLLKHFGSVKKVGEADRESLLQVKGLTVKDVESILYYFISIKI